ncbi:hypothetical protein NL676_009352 [Syzygium grande]|nr:hypothetical protein NL676_009352 [Syzygium grande]
MMRQEKCDKRREPAAVRCKTILPCVVVPIDQPLLLVLISTNTTTAPNQLPFRGELKLHLLSGSRLFDADSGEAESSTFMTWSSPFATA